MGSLVTALASWADARHAGGQWLVRIEDIDPPREVSGATREILGALEAHGLLWDGDVIYQRLQSDSYDNALDQLRRQGRLYACRCTRKQLRAEAADNGNAAYPGHCRHLELDEATRPLRLRVEDADTTFDDLHAGQMTENVSRAVGDFVVRRKDDLYAYQLAVVVDDAQQNISHIVRGADLLDNSPRQIVLQQALGFDRPAYLHLPLVVTENGSKLSKQTGAEALDNRAALDNLQRAWRYLGQPAITAHHSIGDFLAEAVSTWNRAFIPKVDTTLFHI